MHCFKIFAYPCRYADLIPRFGRPVSQLYMVGNLVVDHLNDRFGYFLADLDQPWLQFLKSFANAISNKVAALDNCWGVIDGTVRLIIRPSQHERIFYTGQKRFHAIKLQSVVTHSGMITNQHGPTEGRRHESGILAMSGLLNHLSQYSFSPDDQLWGIYGNPAYPHRVHLQCPSGRRPNLTDEEKAFNQSMSRVYVSVQWVFGGIVHHLSLQILRKTARLAQCRWKDLCCLCSTAKFLTCLYGNNTPAFFDLQPPVLEDYFR